jgi:hypothetical protein
VQLDENNVNTMKTVGSRAMRNLLKRKWRKLMLQIAGSAFIGTAICFAIFYAIPDGNSA